MSKNKISTEELEVKQNIAQLYKKMTEIWSIIKIEVLLNFNNEIKKLDNKK